MGYHQARPHARVRWLVAHGHEEFPLMNEALTILLPKAAEVITIKDIQSISLIHSLSKLFSKVLTNKLTPSL
jgi:hypothetical protein